MLQHNQVCTVNEYTSPTSPTSTSKTLSLTRKYVNEEAVLYQYYMVFVHIYYFCKSISNATWQSYLLVKLAHIISILLIPSIQIGFTLEMIR